jgi:hypothetical protein
MKTSRTIRIVKGAGKSNQASTAESVSTAENKSVRPAAREVAGNVASWVKEFRQRRRPEPRRAFASLFAEPANSLS